MNRLGKWVARIAVAGLLLTLVLDWQQRGWASYFVAADGRAFGTRVLASPQGPVTEQFYRFNPATEVANGGRICTATVSNDCVKWIRFFQLDALNQRSNVTEVLWSDFAAVTAIINGQNTPLLEAVAPPPALGAGRYKKEIPIFATHIAVEADGTTEVEAPFLHNTFGRKPALGVDFRLR